MEQKELIKISEQLLNEELSETVKKTTSVFFNMATLIEYKNGKYGDSATTPLNIFCKHLNKESNVNSILVRLDDKLSRVANSTSLNFNDVCDIMGYLSLLCATKGWTEEVMFNSLKD